MTHRLNPNDVAVRFSTRTPFWPLSFSYGMFADPNTHTQFVSLDHYIGYLMLARYEDRERVMTAPNGWIASRQLRDILGTRRDSEGSPVVLPSWEDNRDAVLDEGLRLKYSQSSFALDVLMRTGDRPIYDVSRDDELHWCHCGGHGRNQHGVALMRLRDNVRSGGVLTSGSAF